jgi:hypothetical protein
MKSVTEFANFNLTQGLKTKASLLAEGKTAEEIQVGLGEAFKIEGDRLKYFVNALDIASQNQEGLKRVLVLSLAEGENAPAKSTKIEELVYVPEFHVHLNRPPDKKSDGRDKRGGKGRQGGGKGGPKESPWGLSPEEKAAKNNKKIVPKADGAAKAPTGKPS